MTPPNNDQSEIVIEDEDTSITDTQPISRVTRVLNNAMQGLDDKCQKTLTKIQALKLAQETGAGVEVLKRI